MKKNLFILLTLFAFQAKAYWINPPIMHSNTCVGDTTFFYVLDTSQLNGVTWNFGDPASGIANTSTLWEPIHIFPGFGTYTVTAIINHSVLGLDTLTLYVLIEAPLVNNILGNDTAICPGSAIVLDPSPVYTFDWFFGASNYLWQDGSGDSVFTATSAGSYWVSVTNSCGTQSDTLVIADLSPLINVTNATICQGQTAILVASGAITYTWPAGATVTGTNTASVTPVITTSYIITGNMAGCLGTAISIVTVNPLPVITVNSPTICNGQTAILTANGGTNYSWSDGAISSGGNTATSAPLATTTYFVTGTSAGCSAIAMFTVTVTELPKVSINNATICQGEQANLIASGADMYTWSAGANSTGINTATAMPFATTNYTVTGTLAGCSNTAIGLVSVKPPPIISAGKDKAIGWGEMVQLSVTEGETFNWFPSLGLSCTDCQNPIANPLETTNYSVTVRGSNGCTTVASVTIEVESPLYIPNAFTPDNDGLNDEFKPVIKDVHDYCFQIFDGWGRQIYETKNIQEAWNGTFRGEICQQDVYVYKITFVGDARNEAQQYSGKVNLIK